MLTCCIVSQFTLLASTRKGSKPDFHGAMAGPAAREIYDHFVAQVQQSYGADRVKNGVFQATMEVGLVNDGPVRDVPSSGETRSSHSIDAGHLGGQHSALIAIEASRR